MPIATAGCKGSQYDEVADYKTIIRTQLSRRVCKKLGVRFLRKARLPEWTYLYKEGQRFLNI